MPFTLAAIVGSTTVILNDGSPFKLHHATGMAGAPIRRVSAQGPAQDGDTDLGYRLGPREIELVIGFQADTDALLDAHRDTLMSVFKPLLATPINLRATRDDGEIRQIDCNLVGKVDIRLVKEHRPGHYHRATVRLRAPDPAYYELAPGTVSAGTISIASAWHLAGGAIGTAQVLDFGANPTQGQAWAYAGTPSSTAGFTIAIRTGKQDAGTIKYPYFVDSGSAPTSIWWRAGTGGFYNTYEAVAFSFIPPGVQSLGTSFMAAGTHNYIHSYNDASRTNYFFGPDGTVDVLAQTNAPLTGATRRWRSDAANSANSRWTPEITLYAVYSPLLTTSQINALQTYMDNTISGELATTLTIPYAGDLPEHPVISITGPLTAARIVNTVTGDTLDFGTVTIGAGSTYVIDTRYGYKDVLLGTVSKKGELTKESDLATWHLAPDPVATGGTNTIAVFGSAISAATLVNIVYYNRYMSV